LDSLIDVSIIHFFGCELLPTFAFGDGSGLQFIGFDIITPLFACEHLIVDIFENVLELFGIGRLIEGVFSNHNFILILFHVHLKLALIGPFITL